MSFFPDLTPYTYALYVHPFLSDEVVFNSDCPSEHGVLNIGWLGEGHKFPAGETSEAFRTALARLCARENMILPTAGFHICEFCPASSSARGGAEVWVRDAKGVWYAAPVLIHHYVTAHGYQPPREFVEAVLHPAEIAKAEELERLKVDQNVDVSTVIATHLSKMLQRHLLQPDVDRNVDPEAWLVLKANIDGVPIVIGVIPHLPSEALRAAFPVRVTVAISHGGDESGLPVYALDLRILDGIDQWIRSWDPPQAVFRNAIITIGGGEWRWVLYATSSEDFEALVPEDDDLSVTIAADPEWSEVSTVLAFNRSSSHSV